jgi:TonB family protein
MDQRPHVSDEEIKDFMDFHGVLTQHDHQIKIIKRTSLIKKIVVSSVVLTAVGVIYWFVQTKERQSPTHQAKEQTKNEVIVAPDEKNVQPESVTEEAEQPIRSSAKEQPRDDAPKKDNSKPERESILPAAEEEKSTEESYVQAEPVKGYQELYDYFAKNLVYPKEAMKDSIQGVSTVSFIINKDGRAAKIQVVNSLGPAFDKEIARLIENMPEWKPALLNGKRVPSKISLPVTFQLQKVEMK